MVKLKAFADYELNNVNKVAGWYNELLPDSILKPIIPNGFYSSWAQYTIQLCDSEQRDRLQKKLKENGSPSMIYYRKGMREEGAFSELENYVKCNVTEKLCQTVLSLPMHPYLEKKDIENICSVIISFS